MVYRAVLLWMKHNTTRSSFRYVARGNETEIYVSRGNEGCCIYTDTGRLDRVPETKPNETSSYQTEHNLKLGSHQER